MMTTLAIQEETSTSIASTTEVPESLKKPVSMLEEEENYPEPETLQEELNAIIDAFYEVAQEADIRAYQRYVEDIAGQKIAEQAIMEPSVVPELFELKDQDGDLVCLPKLLKKGPVVLTFYRGKWCPHCNATLMRYGKYLVPALKELNATLVAISPMLPDGTAFLASKRDLQFPICSDLNNTLAQKFRITFTLQPHSHEWFTKWGDNLPEHNGSEAGWEIPLPATYVINSNGQIVWSFVDNDPAVRANVDQIVEQVVKLRRHQLDNDDNLPRLQQRSRSLSPARSPNKLFNRKIATTFTSFGTDAIIPKIPKFWTLNTASDNTAAATTTTTTTHMMTHDLVAMKLQDEPEDESSHSCASSAHSDGLLISPKRKKKKKIRKTRSAVEFLQTYSLKNAIKQQKEESG